MVSCDDTENALMEIAAISIAAIVWAFWNMVSPEKEEETVRIELVGQDLFKYEGDRIEKVGAKDWMKPLTGISAWSPLIREIGCRLFESWRGKGKGG